MFGYLVLNLKFKYRFNKFKILNLNIPLGLTDYVDSFPIFQRPPRSGQNDRETRRNPERASRRQTRSMGGIEDPSSPLEADVELSLEEEQLEVS